MPIERLRLPVPEACPRCHAAGVIHLESTFQGGALYLSWCCRSCKYEWPVTNAEHESIEGRQGERDRRRITRKDAVTCRKKNSAAGG